MEQHVRVSYGKGFAMAVLLEEVHEGVLKGWCKLRMSDGHECYMAKSAIQSGDTDYRSYLKNHWDEAHGYLRTDCLEEFMKVFIRAYTEYRKKKSNKSGSDKTGTLAQKGEQVTAAARESKERNAGNNSFLVSKAGKGALHHAVQLSLFPDFVAVEAYEPNKKNNHGTKGN